MSKALRSSVILPVRVKALLASYLACCRRAGPLTLPLTRPIDTSSPLTRPIDTSEPWRDQRKPVNPERLEVRRMLSASPSAARPAPAPSHIVAVQSGGTLSLGNVNSVQIIDDGAGGITVLDKSRAGSDPAFATTFSGVTALVIQGTRGDDNISA